MRSTVRLVEGVKEDVPADPPQVMERVADKFPVVTAFNTETVIVVFCFTNRKEGDMESDTVSRDRTEMVREPVRVTYLGEAVMGNCRV